MNDLLLAKELRRIVNRLRYNDLPQEERDSLINEYFWVFDYAEEEGIELDDSIRLYENYRKRNKRLRSRIKAIIKNDSLFLTFTFRPDVLESTSPETRHQYVRKFLKSISSNYVANLDYGGKFGREHYHAVCIVSGKINYKAWKYGALNGQKIRSNSEPIALAKYINKLTYHAVKDTSAKNIIYSRQN